MQQGRVGHYIWSTTLLLHLTNHPHGRTKPPKFAKTMHQYIVCVHVRRAAFRTHYLIQLCRLSQLPLS
uniref:Uncharacterized protein n=1 Tax=Arundo donax TaxID=35708 RepID=A0A0A9HLZ0_ARUDO